MKKNQIAEIKNKNTIIKSFTLFDIIFDIFPKYGQLKNGIIYSTEKLGLGIKGKECGLFATPNTMDHMGMRSKDAMKKMITNGARKNRSKPGNLREQVNPEMCKAVVEARLESNNIPIDKWEEQATKWGYPKEMWPTPTSSMMTMGDFIQAKYHSSKRPPYKEVNQMFPTPEASSTGRSPSAIKKMRETNKRGIGLKAAVKMFPTPTATERSGINPNTGKGAGLSKTIKMFPTPTTQEIEHPELELNENGRRKTKDGDNSHSLNLADTVKMFPTPRVSDTEGGVVKNVELKDGNFSRVNKDGVRWGVKLKDAVGCIEEKRKFPTPIAGDWKGQVRKNGEPGMLSGILEKEGKEKQKMFPTPTTRDYKGARKSETLKASGRNENNSLPDKVKNKGQGNLNPDWVGWLMGYPRYWTDIDKETGEFDGWHKEPDDIPRLTTEKKNRVNRLKCLGNAVVPQCVAVVGKLILESGLI